MKLSMKIKDFNSIINRCKKYRGNDTTSPVLGYVLLDVRAPKELYVTALDGHKGITFSVACNSAETGKILLPAFKPLNKTADGNVEIKADRGNITVSTAGGSQTLPTVETDYPNFQRLFPKDEPLQTVYFDPKLLADALSAFAGPVKIDLMPGPGCFQLTDIDGAKALALPLSPKTTSKQFNENK